MTTNQKIVTSVVIAVIATVLLYMQPKYVVDNEKLEKADQITQQSSGNLNSVHSSTLQEDLEPIIYSLKSKIKSENSENLLSFADSLATIYFKLGYLDSAVIIGEHVESLVVDNSDEFIGNIYFKASNFSKDKDRSVQLARKAKERFDKVLEVDPNNVEVKTNLAMILVASENPMSGILMLREIVEKDPNNWEANFNLGMLSIQSGQYTRAVERFEKLLTIDSLNVQANFYLAFSLFEDGQLERAKEIFERVKSLDDDPTVLDTVNDYLQKIEKNIK